MKSIFLILTLIIFASCKKISLKPEISGSVLDDGSKTGIKDAEVVLIEKENSISQSGTFRIVAQQLTNEKGEFTFEYKKKTGYHYLISATKPDYDQIYSFYEVQDKRKQFISITLQSPGYVRIRVKNMSPVDFSDYCYLQPPKQNQFTGPFNGTNIDTLILCKIAGNKNTEIGYFTTKDQIQKNGSFSVYCAAFDTVFYEFNY